jgi:hypothetical protein
VLIPLALLLGAGASYASAPSGTYEAHLTPFDSDVTGTATLTHDLSGWTATVQLSGLEAGHTYEYEVSIAGAYVEGQAHSSQSFPLCSFVATSGTGSCGTAGAHLGRSTLTPQSSGFVYSREAHTSVTSGQFGYLAELAPYNGFSNGGEATLTPNVDGTWSGRVQVSGLTVGLRYTWGADIADAWLPSGQAVGWSRVVLCHFVATTARVTGCGADHVSIEGAADIPSGSFTDVASSVTSVASGTLY